MKTFLLLSLIAFSSMAQMPKWSYDAGPDPKSDMGKELIDITASIPNFAQMSLELMGTQKFRPAFGPIPWRMLLDENKVKMLFIGQDGTHIAEAAGRPATAGFGGRAQDLANYFGVNEGAAFINTYAFTIKGQYGIYNTPYIQYDENGEPEVKFSNFVDNKFWLLSMAQESPMVKWRNSLIDWIIRNNKKSMKLIVLFGGAARDAIATYAISKGAKVTSWMERFKDSVQVPVTNSEYAGGNNTFPSLVAKDGGDLYEDMLGRRVDYKSSRDQKAVVKDLKENLKKYIQNMAFTKGGDNNNGLINMAQLGGFDLETMVVNHAKTISLKGLKLDDGSVIENDILVISLPHPSYLSRLVMDADSYYEGKEAASRAVMKNVRALDKYADKGWNIEADQGKTNYYALGENYEYGRSDIGPEFYDFGTPANRMVSKSTARRMSRNANVVIIGTRDNGRFDMDKIKDMTYAKPGSELNEKELFIARPSSFENRYVFDRGPGEYFAKLMKTTIDYKSLYTAKEGMSFDEDGISAFNIKSHPSVEDFGHYRGTFKSPKVVILADPIGYDDIITARALTGTRGQYIQGLMDALEINDDYLVIKTVPFGMDGATKEEWAYVLDKTNKYRETLLKTVLADNDIIVMADGEYALKEATRIIGERKIIIDLGRSVEGTFEGLVPAAEKLNELSIFNNDIDFIKMANIPRSHLSFYSRVWEGTSGDRVITSYGKQYEGIAFAEVVPAWAYNQNWENLSKSSYDISALIRLLRVYNLPLPGESIVRFLERTNNKNYVEFDLAI
jgi:hypothetical protein